MMSSVAGLLRTWAFLAGLAVVVVAGPLQYRELSGSLNVGTSPLPEKKDHGSFYLGVHLQHVNRRTLPSVWTALESRLDVSFSILSVHPMGMPENLEDFPGELLWEAIDQGRVPMITWTPWTSGFPGQRSVPDFPSNREVFFALLRGELDDDLRAYAERLRDLRGPVLLRFAPQADDANSPWSAGAGTTPSELRAAWEQVYRLFQSAGASNVGWVWTPGSAETSSEYYPGEDLVDWIATDVNADGVAAPDCERRSFSELYARSRPRFLAYGKPVLVGEFGSPLCEGDRAAWLLQALTDIRADYPEIGGVVVGEARKAAPDWNGPQGDAVAAELRRLGLAPTIPRANEPPSTSPPGRNHSIQGSPGDYDLIVDGRRFYIRGVAYSPDDWRSGRIPLSRRRLEEDFTAIRSMGANTIRRYGTGWYDHNVLTVADEQDLKVLMGFWLAPDVDYLEDRDAVRRYELEIVEAVESLRRYPAVLGWVLGNETWGQLNKHFRQPKLTRVRRAYTELVERLAVRIHELDPDRPVMTALEHTESLPGTVRDFARFAPSVDVIAVNSYYRERLAVLSATFESFDPSRPFLAGEFGPDGYWDHRLSQRQSNGLMSERPGSAKAEQYVAAWTEFIAPEGGRNIGGIAYCWRERQEGTATWFGLTDAYGRKKPAYFALRRAWRGEKMPGGPTVFSIESRADEFEVEQEFDFFANADPGEDLDFEWSLLRDDFHDPGADLEPFVGGRAVRVRLPDEPGVYRLYLHVSTSDDRVDTASFALRVAPRGWLGDLGESR